MRAAVAIADRHEVTLAFEPEINNVVSSVMRARRLLDEIDSPWLKVVIDPANLLDFDDLDRLSEIVEEAAVFHGQCRRQERGSKSNRARLVSRFSTRRSIGLGRTSCLRMRRTLAGSKRLSTWRSSRPRIAEVAASLKRFRTERVACQAEDRRRDGGSFGRRTRGGLSMRLI